MDILGGAAQHVQPGTNLPGCRDVVVELLTGWGNLADKRFAGTVHSR